LVAPAVAPATAAAAAAVPVAAPAVAAPVPPLGVRQAGSIVAAALASLKSPLAKKKWRFSLSSGWARDNYDISLK
jgi:hypothetical protein